MKSNSIWKAIFNKPWVVVGTIDGVKNVIVDKFDDAEVAAIVAGEVEDGEVFNAVSGKLFEATGMELAEAA